jgi:hypothetical protein
VKDFGNHFRAIVEGALPDEPRILIPRGGDGMMILVTWALPAEPFRPPRRSRMVRISVSEEAIGHYAGSDAGMRCASDVRFLSWLKQQLDGFDPTHDSPLGVEPAPVTWQLGTLELNG